MSYLNLDVFRKSNANTSQDNNDETLTPSIMPVSEETQDPPKRKRGRPRKSEQQTNTNTVIENNLPSTNQSNTVSMCQSSEPYIDTFNETNNMLKYSIMQFDVLAGDVKSELDTIRNSKTLKGKYKYIADLCSTASSLVSSTIYDIKEINEVNNNCHKLEL